MVESLGYRIRRLFVGVFAAGSALAGLGGALWGMNQQIVVPQIGGQVNVLLFIVIIIGGLGSTLGCLVGALLVGLVDQLRRLPRAEAGHVLEHRPDGRGADLAAAGPLSGRRAARTTHARPPRSPTTCRATAGWRWCCSLIVVGLALTPFIFPGTKALNVAAKVIVFIVLAASFDLLLGYTGIVSFAHTMFFGIGAYGIAIATTRHRADLGRARRSARSARSRSRLVLSFVIGLFSLRVQGDLLRHDHARRRLGVPTLASQLSEITGGEDGLTFKVPAALQPGTEYVERAVPRRLDRRPLPHLLPGLLRRPAARAGAAADRQLAVRPGAAGDPRERLPGRGDRLPHRRLPHHRQRRLGAVRHPRRRAARALAALQRARHDALVRDHARRAADRRHRRHGHDLRRGRRQRAAGAGAELPAGPDEGRRRAACRTFRCSSQIVSPDRWLLWLGILFVLSVYYFPNGVVGRLRAMRRRPPATPPARPRRPGGPRTPASASGPRAPPDRSA